MTDLHTTPPHLLVLHTLRCHGFASTDRLGRSLADVAAVDVEGQLLTLAAQGLVTHHGGAFAGWGLTDAGRAADTEGVAVELDRAGAHDAVRAAYRRFLDLNRRVLDICAAWQIRDGDRGPSVNDHTDRAYDARVLRELAAVDAEAQLVCAQLAAQLQRFSHYGPRLARALGRAKRGERDQVTDSLDSYHTVWFQLHEDLLLTLGLSRQS